MKKFHDDEYEKCDAILEIAARFITQVSPLFIQTAYHQQKEKFDSMEENGEFEPSPEEVEEGITSEEKILEKKSELGLFIYDVRA